MWGGQAAAQIADGLVKVALLWFVYTLTGSALKMTVIGLLQTLPPLLLGPVIGVYLDRLPKKPVMIAVDLARAALTLLIPVLHGFDALTLERLYLLVFLTAIFSAVFGPALSASVPLIVSREHLTAANAWIQSTVTVGMVLGPAMGGSGIAVIGIQNVLYLGAPAFALSAFLLMPIAVKEPLRHRGELPSSFGTFLDDLKVGLRFIFTENRAIRLMMIVAVLHSLAASAFVFLLPVHASKVLQAGAAELGWLWSMYGVGMLAVSVALGFVPQGRPETRFLTMAGSMAIGGLASVGMGLFNSLGAGIVMVTLIGGSLALVTPTVWARLQELTPEDMRGRIFTVFGSAAMCASMIGILAFGWSADALGAKPSLLAMGGILTTTAAVSVRLRRSGTADRAPLQRKAAGTSRR